MSGKGSPGNETPQHWAALREAERRGYEKPGTTERLIQEAAEREKAAVAKVVEAVKADIAKWSAKAKGLFK
jgi:hypothetical protein